jgi:hypothetical protein
MAITFYVLPSALELNVRGGLSNPSPTPLSQVPGTVDDKSRVSWNPGSSPNGDGWYSRLTMTCPTVTQDHGGITKVEVLARMFRSGLGPDKWNLTENPFVAIGGDIDKDGLFAEDLSHWFVPEWHRYEGYTIWCGANLAGYYWNRNTQANPLAVYQWTWDVTSRRVWDNAALSGMRFQLRIDKNQLIGGSSFYRTGWQREGGGNTPRWDCSQFILRITANDPPIPYATGGYFMGGG